MKRIPSFGKSSSRRAASKEAREAEGDGEAMDVAVGIKMHRSDSFTKRMARRVGLVKK